MANQNELLPNTYNEVYADLMSIANSTSAMADVCLVVIVIIVCLELYTLYAKNITINNVLNMMRIYYGIIASLFIIIGVMDILSLNRLFDALLQVTNSNEKSAFGYILIVICILLIVIMYRPYVKSVEKLKSMMGNSPI